MHEIATALYLFCAAFIPLGVVSGANGADRTGCAACHRTEAASQPVTPMGRALEQPGTNLVLQAHPKLTFRRGEFTYTVTTQRAQSTYSVTDGTNTLSLPILWGMGAGAQTWILSMNGEFYESLVSYFPKKDGLGITLGDEISTPHTLVEAMGRQLTQQDVKSCFGCHTTGAIVNDKLDLSSFKPGVTCERCHVGSLSHRTDSVKHNYNTAPPSLSALSSEDLSNFCGECHRTWSSVVLHRAFGEINVRFSPYRLALSKCYNGTDSRIGCTACHNPHVNVNTNSASYDPNCLSCHTQSKTASPNKPELKVTSNAKACPIAKSNCVTCHMPKVTEANGSITFTDHFIRIVKTEEPYPD
jgi:hypothetical protein